MIDSPPHSVMRADGKPAEPASPIPFVYVLVLNWNNASATADFLESCMALTYFNFQVVVIDNGSEAGSLDSLMAQYPATQLIISESNLGFAAGMNAGIQYALQHGADFIFLANNDTWLAPDMLDRLIQASIAHKADLASPAIYIAGQSERIWSIGGWRSRVTLEITQCYRHIDIAHLREPFAVDYITGCGMLMRACSVKKIGLFDERFFMYYEDSDFCLRAHNQGGKLIVVPDATMQHRVALTIGGLDSPAERYHMALASVQFFKKHVRGWRWLIVLPYRSASACKTVVRLIWSGHLSSARAYVRGLWHGLRT